MKATAIFIQTVTILRLPQSFIVSEMYRHRQARVLARAIVLMKDCDSFNQLENECMCIN